METLITRGIRVSVEPAYQPAYSKPLEFRFIFSYRITIENLSTSTVQLLRRHWVIWDSHGQIREVEGEGVIGEQPILIPGQTHQYESWCQLATDVGKMHGSYLMVDLGKGEEFSADIPQFTMIAPFKFN